MASSSSSVESLGRFSSDDDDIDFEPELPPQPVSRPLGKSPASSDSSMSSLEVKKMKLAEDESEKNKESPQTQGPSQNAMSDASIGDIEDWSYYDEDYVIGSGSSEGFISTDSSVSSHDKNFEVLSPVEIVKLMKTEIENTKAILQLPSRIIRVLLSAYRWDKEMLFNEYYAAGDADREKLLKDNGATLPKDEEKAESPSLSMTSITSESSEECEICCVENPSSRMHQLECGHRFCAACWSQYLTDQIMHQGVGMISCVAHDCKVLVDDATVTKLVTEDVGLKYQKLITDSFVQCNRYLKWCPSPDCTFAIKVLYLPEAKSVVCNCGHSFCFQCLSDAHDPIWCQMLQKWLKKCDNDSDTSRWITANTKQCPKCHANIQKNGGCNHMFCTNKSCNMEFCWVCLGPWVRHDPYRCNQYNANGAEEARNEQERSRAGLHRYIHYLDRYGIHKNSLKLENELYKLIDTKMVTLIGETSNVSWVELQFLKQVHNAYCKAVMTLCRCRETLMYTFVFAYYVKKTDDNSQIEIFESNQQNLQTETEKLSAYLERDVQSDNVDLCTLKQKVNDMFKYCERRRQVLIKHVLEGQEKDWWKFHE